MAAREAWWASPDHTNRVHIWWHRSLFHIELGQYDAALALYDGPIRETQRPFGVSLTNASALLWRLDLLGCDVGDRWRGLAQLWQGHADGACLAFADIHAAMAELRSGQEASVERRLGWMRETAARDTEQASCYRDVGVPVVEGLFSFHRGDYAQAVATLQPVRYDIWRIGGSHAQRDIVDWTLTEAALRAGMRDVALSLVTNSLVTRATTGGTVSLIVQPDDSVSAYAVEESLPVGITPYDIEGDGSWDPVARQVKWGPYLDNTPRTLSYRVGGIAGLYEVAGVASYDGQSVAVIGQANVDLESSLRIAAPVLSPSDGGLVLTFPTQPDRAYYVEVSTDLSEGHWQVAAGPLAGNGQCLSWKAPAGRPGGAAASRFYRVRMAP